MPKFHFHELKISEEVMFLTLKRDDGLVIKGVVEDISNRRFDEVVAVGTVDALVKADFLSSFPSVSIKEGNGTGASTKRGIYALASGETGFKEGEASAKNIAEAVLSIFGL